MASLPSKPALVAACLAACLAAPAAHAATVERPLPETDYSVQPTCPPASPGRATCLALRLVPLTAQAKAHTTPLGLSYRVRPAAVSRQSSPAEGAYGLTPADLHTAYNLPQATLVSPGQTIALVDAYNDPKIEADLAVYDREFGLPECTHANGCLKVVNQEGAESPLPNSTSTEALGWSGEISLDVEIAHGICEDCKILLVEAESELVSNLTAGVRAAKALGATVISASWGSAEPLLATEAESFNLPGIAVVAAAGDLGYRNWYAGSAEQEYVDYPAASPDVLAAAGTRLELGPSGTYPRERVWNGKGATGGGCAERTFFTAPTWQSELPNWSEVGCGTKRAVADLAADGDPYTGVAIYNTDGGNGWETLGGTSLSSPILAAAIALAGGVPEKTKYIAETIYANAHLHPTLLHLVSEGSNGRCEKPFGAEGLSGCTTLEEGAQCEQHEICVATTGYSGAAGLGSPYGDGLFAANGSAPPAQQVSTTTSQSSTSQTTTVAVQQSQTTSTTQTTATTTTTTTETIETTETTASPTPVRQPSIRALRLAAVSRAALRRRARPQLRRLRFQLLLSAPAAVRATLFKLERRGRRVRLARVGRTLRLVAHRTNLLLALRGRAALVPGRYRLVVWLGDRRHRALTFAVR